MSAFFAWIKRIFTPKAEPIRVVPAPPPVQQKPAETNARVLGLDVAHFQDRMDAAEWKTAFDKGYRFVFCKATDGILGKDSKYTTHMTLARRAGFLCGPYHFLRFGYESAGQAKHFYKTSGHGPGDLPPVLDIEWDRYTLGGKYGSGRRMDDWAEIHAKECVEAIWQLFGVRPIIYTNAYFFPEKAKNAAFWSQFKCWIPSYADSLKPSGDKVKVPSPWKQWNFWQDSDDLTIGDVKAIDTNVFRGSLEDLRNLVKK